MSIFSSFREKILFSCTKRTVTCRIFLNKQKITTNYKFNGLSVN